MVPMLRRKPERMKTEVTTEGQFFRLHRFHLNREQNETKEPSLCLLGQGPGLSRIHTVISPFARLPHAK